MFTLFCGLGLVRWSDAPCGKEPRRALLAGHLMLLVAAHHCAALTIAGLEVPHAQLSPTSRALDRYEWPEKFPYSKQDLTPDWDGNDR